MIINKKVPMGMIFRGKLFHNGLAFFADALQLICKCTGVNDCITHFTVIIIT